jgi:ankyrin repeat protein
MSNRALRETLRRQREEQVLEQQEKSAGSATSGERDDLFNADSITPLMRAASKEDPSELLDLLNSERDGTGTTISSSLFVKDTMGRTALDWARVVNNEMNVVALRKAMLGAIHDARVDLVANDLDTSERVRVSNKEAGRAILEAVKQRRAQDAIDIIVANRELDRELVEDFNDKLIEAYDEEMSEFNQFKERKMALHVQRGGFKEDRLDYGPTPVEPKIVPYFVNSEDHSGFSVLMIAASWDMIDVVTALVDLGAKVEHTNKYGHTALTWACTVGHSEIIKKLLFHGANIHHVTLEGRTGLHYACLYLKAHVVSTLLDTLFERFSNYRLQHAKAAFDATRWTRYATMLEKFIDIKDKNGKRAWELLPIPPPGHKVFNGEAALRKEQKARLERKRAKRAAKMAAMGESGSAGADDDDDDSYDSLDDESEEEGEGDSDEEDRRAQQELKDNDPEHQEILAELARVKGVVEGHEDARPVVTPSNPNAHQPTPQQLQMLEAAAGKENPEEEGGKAMAVGGGKPTEEEMSHEVIVPLHLRSSGLAYGSVHVVDTDAIDPMSSVPGIDGYDDPGNLFVRTRSGTPKYAGKDGVQHAPLAPTVKLRESREVRPTSRQNILDAQQEVLRTEIYSADKQARNKNEKIMREATQKQKQQARLSPEYVGAQENRVAFIKKSQSVLIKKPSDGLRVKTPQEVFLEEKKLRVEAAGGEEFVYSSDFRSPPPSGSALYPSDSPDRQSSPMSASRSRGDQGDKGLLTPLSFFSPGTDGGDSFANVLDDTVDIAGAGEAGMQSRPMTATEKAEQDAALAYAANENQVKTAQREYERVGGASVPGGSNDDNSATINALGTMHNYYTGPEAGQTLSTPGSVPNAPNAEAFGNAATGGVGGGVGGGGGFAVNANGVPVPVSDDVSVLTADDDEAHATGLHGIAPITDKFGGESNVNSHVVEVHQIGMLLVHARERIEEWRVSADKEAALMEKVECWLGCGAMESVEGVAAHVRDLCPYRAKECMQCRGIYRFCDLADHMTKDCLKRRVACSNSFAGCNEMITFDFVYRHEQLRCKWRKVPCRLNCGGQIPLCKRDEHEEYHCNLRNLTCDQCKQLVHAVKFGIHLRDECEERFVKCTVSCQCEFRAKDLHVHETEVCVKKCKWGCGATIGPLPRRELHQAIQCPRRPVDCDNGCGMKGLIAEYLQEHIRYQCPYEHVRCPNDCGIRLTRISLPLHLDSWHGKCPARLVRCPSNLVGWRVLVVKDEEAIIPLRNTHSVFEKSTADATLTYDENGEVSTESKASEISNKKRNRDGRDEDDNRNGNDAVLCVPVGVWKESVDESGTVDAIRTDSDKDLSLVPMAKVAIGTKTTVSGKDKIVNKGRAVKDDVDVGEISGGDVGIVLRYHRAQLGAAIPAAGGAGGDDENLGVVTKKLDEQDEVYNDVTKLTGMDRIYVQFHNRHEWLDYWSITRRIIPIKKVKGSVETAGHRYSSFKCGWVRYSSFDDHLNYDCINRQVWLPGVQDQSLVGGDGFATVADEDNPSMTGTLTTKSGIEGLSRVYRGQATTFEGSVEAARTRNEIDEFIVKPNDTVRCDYCANQFGFGAIERHQKFDCGKVVVRCKLGCGMKIQRESVDEHAKEECVKRPLTCTECGEEGLWVDEIDDHLANRCPERPAQCFLGCGVKGLRAHNEEHHRLNECLHRLVTCTCEKVMKMDDLEDHQIVDCVNKPTLCPQGCGETIPRDQVSFHIENLCAKKAVFFSKKVFCPIGCGLRLMRRDVLEHVSYYCKRRLSDCPFGCGQSVQFDKLRLHLYFCPKRPVTCEPGAKECNKLFFKWFYCEDSSGDYGGVGYDGDIPGDGPNMSNHLQEMAELFHTSPEPSRLSSPVHNYSRVEDSSNNASGTDSATPWSGHEGDILIKNNGMGLNSNWVANDNTQGVDARPVNKKRPQSVQILEEPRSDNGEGDDDDASALTMYDPRKATATPLTANGGYMTPSGRYRNEGDGAGRKTPLPKGASIFFDDHKMFFHAGLRMRACKRHQTTALMAAVRQSEFPLAEFVIDSCEGMDMEMESNTGETALTIACRQGKLKFVELLIQGGADINHETSTGKTALIEAVRASTENIPMIEFLVKSGALVAYKTQKHNRTAIDWARLLILPASLRILELGRVVQQQTDELFSAIGSGNMKDVERLIGDGEFFEPNNESRLFIKMENEIEITRKAHADVADLKNNLNGMTEEVEESRDALAITQKVFDEASEMCEATFVRQETLQLKLSKLFVSYERIAHTLLKSDLEEISRMRRPPMAVRAAVFAFGIMLGELDYVKEYPHNDVLDMQSAHKWWPKLAYLLSKSQDTIRKIRSFSLAKLLSDIQAPFLARARSLYQVLKTAILTDEGLLSDDGGPIDTARSRPGLTQATTSSHVDAGMESDGSMTSTDRRAHKKRKIKKSSVLPDFVQQQKKEEKARKRQEKKEAAKKAAAVAARSKKRPSAPPSIAGVDDDDDSSDSEVDGEGGGDSTIPVALTSWHAQGERSSLNVQKTTGKLALPKDLGLKDPWYLESQKKAQVAAEAAAKEARLREKEGEDAAIIAGGKRNFIADVEWDSEADEAGGGEWGPDGEWKPVVKKRSKWWKTHEAERLEKEAEEKAAADEAARPNPYTKENGETEVKNEIADVDASREEDNDASMEHHEHGIHRGTSRPVTSENARRQNAPDVGLDDAAFNATLKNNASSHFVRSILVLLKAADQLAIERKNIENMKVETVQAGQVKEDARVKHQTAQVRFSGAVSKRLTTEKILTDMMKYARFTLGRAKDFREKLRVFRLLDKVTLSGHTALSWAASLGNMDALEMLLSHGATTGYTTQLLHLSATFIQQSYRLYRFITEARRSQKDNDEKAKLKKKKLKEAAGAWKPKGGDAAESEDDSDDDGGGGGDGEVASVGTGVTDMAVANTGEFAAMNNSLVIEQMFKLKRARGHVLHKIRYFRQKMRFPVPEAAYKGNWQIIHKIYERRLYHHNFSHSWIFPSPPPPFIRVFRRFVAKPRKLDMHEIMTQGMNDMAAGMYVDGQGWVGPNDPRDHFGECHEKLTDLWNTMARKKNAVLAERLKLRRLTDERIKQKAAVPLMIDAIRNREYRSCVYYSTQCGVSIDMETPEGSTVLVGASEEDTGVPFYAPMVNDDGRPCLAVEYLLDRTDYRPSVNLELLNSGHNALIRACSLGRASVVEALCDRGAEVNYVNKHGRSPLHYAAQVGSFLVCRILLERGADVHKATPEGETAYSIAEQYGFLPIMTQMGRHAAGFMGPVRPHRGRVDEFIRCPRGCGESFIKEDLNYHEGICINRIVKCPLQCGTRLLMFKELAHHENQECVRRIVPCQHCGEMAEERLQPKHYDTTCRYRYVPCVLGCGKDIQVIEMKKHFKFCTWREITCTQGCGAKLMIKDMIEHDTNVCDMRKLPCPLKCGSLVSTRLTTHHMHNVCPNRIAPCRWCDTQMEFRYVEAHERSCNIRHEQCPTKCGEAVCIGAPMEEHMKTTCGHRFVYCPDKCGQKVRWADIPGHRKHLCGSRLVPCPLNCVEDETLPVLEQRVLHLRAKMIDVHKGFECPQRPMQCVLCKRTDVRAKELTRHKEVLCEMREVNCRNMGCAKKVNLGTREEHERKTCKFRPLSCPLGCGMEVPWIQHGKHTQKICSMRRVECPLKCGTTGIRYRNLNDHMATECPRRHASGPGDFDGKRAHSRGGSRPSTRGADSGGVEIGTKIVSPVKTNTSSS